MPKFDKPDSPNIIWGVNALEEDLTRPDDSYIQTGWTQVKPPYEYENYSMNKLYQGFAYYNQLGFPEWDSTTEYQANKSYVQASNNRVYKCIQTHVNKNPATSGNESFWERLRVTDAEIKTLFNANNNPPVFACRVWGNFNGITMTIRGSGNIENISKISTGTYQVTFDVGMPDASYSVITSCSTSSSSGPANLQDTANPFDLTTSGFKIKTFASEDGVGDMELITVSVFR